MKKIAFFALIAGAVALTSCGGNKKEDGHEGHDHSHAGHDHSHDTKKDSVVVVDSTKTDSVKVDTTKAAN